MYLAHNNGQKVQDEIAMPGENLTVHPRVGDPITHQESGVQVPVGKMDTKMSLTANSVLHE